MAIAKTAPTPLLIIPVSHGSHASNRDVNAPGAALQWLTASYSTRFIIFTTLCMSSLPMQHGQDSHRTSR
jgi:hypothetical protein